MIFVKGLYQPLTLWIIDMLNSAIVGEFRVVFMVVIELVNVSGNFVVLHMDDLLDCNA